MTDKCNRMRWKSLETDLEMIIDSFELILRLEKSKKALCWFFFNWLVS